MIHTSFSASPWPEQPPVLHLSLVGTADIQKFRDLLGRALNTAPEFGADWFALADRIDQFLAPLDIPIPSLPLHLPGQGRAVR